MLKKFIVLIDGKLTHCTFSIHISNDTIRINQLDYIDCHVKVPVYTIYNGLDYIPIFFPLEMQILNNKVINQYICVTSYNSNVNNDLDFFYQIRIVLQSHNVDFYKLSDVVDNENFRVITKYFTDNFTIDYSINHTDIRKFAKYLWDKFTIIRSYLLIVLVKYPNLTNKNIKELLTKYQVNKKILGILSSLKEITYRLDESSTDIKMTFSEYCELNCTAPLKYKDIKVGCSYYITLNSTDLLTTDIEAPLDIKTKTVKINVKNKNNNLVTISENRSIIFDNYKWFYYYPKLIINKDNVLYRTFINNDFIVETIRTLFNIEKVHASKINDFYVKNFDYSGLMILANVFQNNKDFLDDINLIRTKSYSNSFFEYITEKYSNNKEIVSILHTLFDNYNYPFKPSKHELDSTFDHIIYFSLYNYKQIFISNKKIFNELLHPDINSVVPQKLKNLYINLLRGLNQVINNEYDLITYNQKYYSDFLHKGIIKIFVGQSDSLSVNLFRLLVKNEYYNKFKYIITTNLLLSDISLKLSWANLPKKLNYLSYFFKNQSILYFQEKINKNIITDTFDSRIRKVIENPFEMYRFIRKEKDFVRWTKFISDKIPNIYITPISLSTDDFIHIGKMIYLLFSITEQNINEESYSKFLNFCNQHNKLVLDSNRINLNIREYFPSLKVNINLGILAKHLTRDKEIITFDEPLGNNDNEVGNNIKLLETKLHIATKKYYKYKAKYLETKGTESRNLLISGSEHLIRKVDIVSDTSSVIPNAFSKKK